MILFARRDACTSSRKIAFASRKFYSHRDSETPEVSAIRRSAFAGSFSPRLNLAYVRMQTVTTRYRFLYLKHRNGVKAVVRSRNVSRAARIISQREENAAPFDPCSSRTAFIIKCNYLKEKIKSRPRACRNDRALTHWRHARDA